MATADTDGSGLIRRMGKVEEYRTSLQTLQTVWDNLTLLGHLSGTGADMADTRQAFQQLTANLLSQLGRETFRKTLLAMRAKAQVAIDIMIRNLYERTADIGFLAMDDEVRQFMSAASTASGEPGSEEACSMRARFAEYISKYSLYSNIILLDTAGNLLLQLDQKNVFTHSSDPLIAQTLAGHDGYVETFGESDLLPGRGENLIYSSRISSADGEKILGVLCLCFRFSNEAAGIFANLIKKDDWSIATLLAADGRVIASSDPHHIAVGAVLPHVLKADWAIVRFAGREYLAATCRTQGYQGYQGPGWYGHVMLPLDHAFDHEFDLDMKSIPANMLKAVMGNNTLFNDSLRDIPLQAAKIQRGLNRSVWNGNVNQRRERKALTPAFSKVLLWEISNTGFKTQEIFERSISNLHQTVVSSILQDSQFQAELAIDIMDRNLYERACDCRWWAQAGVFRSYLTSNDSSLPQVQSTLAQINSLYTVYSLLVLFDRNCRVVAVSNPHYQSLCGKQLNEEWGRQTLALPDSQSYAVSPFAASSLYEGRHTYIYAAALREAGDGQTAVGGIGIVFDSEPQFNSMLLDALPRDESGQVPAGCFGLFADRKKRIIASTREEFATGTVLPLDDTFFRAANGGTLSGIAELGGQYYAVGASMSKGYREYKSDQDSYRNDVVALIFVSLGEKKEERREHAKIRRRVAGSVSSGADSDSIEIATFYVDDNWLGIPSEHVIEAVDAQGITSVPGSSSASCGYMMFRGNVILVVGLWGIVGDGGRRRSSQNPQVIVINTADDNNTHLGIMVDELGEIPEIPLNRIEKISAMVAGDNMLAESLVKPEGGNSHEEMMVVLSPERIRQRFLCNR